MEKNLVLRGALAGALAGLLTFVFARVFAGPEIQAAIDYEQGREAAQHAADAATGHLHGGGGELFDRAVQANLGMGIGVILFGVAMGVLLAVVFAVALGRVGKLRPRPLALLVAGAGFLVFFLVPFVKYPGNPPAVGHSDTIGTRVSMYLIMVAVAGLALLATVLIGRWLASRLGNWNASMLAGAVFIVVIGVAVATLPSFVEVPQALRTADGTTVYDGFPADVLADFRLYSVIAQALLWSSMGLVFGPLAERVLSRGRISGRERGADCVLGRD